MRVFTNSGSHRGIPIPRTPGIQNTLRMSHGITTAVYMSTIPPIKTSLCDRRPSTRYQKAGMSIAPTAAPTAVTTTHGANNPEFGYSKSIEAATPGSREMRMNDTSRLSVNREYGDTPTGVDVFKDEPSPVVADAMLSEVMTVREELPATRAALSG